MDTVLFDASAAKALVAAHKTAFIARAEGAYGGILSKMLSQIEVAATMGKISVTYNTVHFTDMEVRTPVIPVCGDKGKQVKLESM
jgi:hypothetical protein